MRPRRCGPSYFVNIFNPARLHVKATLPEVPKKYWKNLPETRLIPGMIGQAEHRVSKMQRAARCGVSARAEKILARQRVDKDRPGFTTLADRLRHADR